MKEKNEKELKKKMLIGNNVIAKWARVFTLKPSFQAVKMKRVIAVGLHDIACFLRLKTNRTNRLITSSIERAF
jgi:hypothetical protein